MKPWQTYQRNREALGYYERMRNASNLIPTSTIFSNNLFFQANTTSHNSHHFFSSTTLNNPTAILVFLFLSLYNVLDFFQRINRVFRCSTAGSVSTHAGSVSTHASSVSTSAGFVSTSAGSVSTSAGFVSTSAGFVSTHAGSVSTHAGSVSTHAGSVSTYESIKAVIFRLAQATKRLYSVKKGSFSSKSQLAKAGIQGLNQWQNFLTNHIYLFIFKPKLIEYECK